MYPDASDVRLVNLNRPTIVARARDGGAKGRKKVLVLLRYLSPVEENDWLSSESVSYRVAFGEWAVLCPKALHQAVSMRSRKHKV